VSSARNAGARIAESIGRKKAGFRFLRPWRRQIRQRRLGKARQRSLISATIAAAAGDSAGVRVVPRSEISIGYPPVARMDAISSSRSAILKFDRGGQRPPGTSIHQVDKSRIGMIEAAAWRSAAISSLGESSRLRPVSARPEFRRFLRTRFHKGMPVTAIRRSQDGGRQGQTLRESPFGEAPRRRADEKIDHHRHCGGIATKARRRAARASRVRRFARCSGGPAHRPQSTR